MILYPVSSGVDVRDNCYPRRDSRVEIKYHWQRKLGTFRGGDITVEDRVKTDHDNWTCT